MNSDIERLCRGLYERFGADWDAETPEMKADCAENVVGVLQELRNPSEGMVAAGIKANSTVEDIWQAMIDHLLRDSDEQD